MKNKKIVLIFTILFIVLLIGGYFAIKYVKSQQMESNVEEFVPEEEITEDQLRQTIVSLYFPSKETKELVPEARLVDIKEIINNPCDKLVNLLIEGPKSDKTQKIIPESTKLLKSYMEDDCVVLDLSSEFLDYNKEDNNVKTNMIKSIVNTLTELTEVNKVKILINGSINEEFNETYLREK
ncbi:MAG: GerMN domain-containing protein [Bacilli bacterium]|nr:GerMN domain-containing protein [Clostridia bacterium]MCI9435340.1 GerMN domain-containing protein [Bacilli bacterium]